MKRIKILCALFAFSMIISNFVGCNIPSVHNHEYKNGECACGEFDKEYYTPGLEFMLNDGGDGYIVTSFDKSSGSVVIPQIKGGLPVKGIGDDVFANSANLVKIRIPNTIEFIGDYAFWGCNLITLTIPENVKSIGEYAFNNCGKLKELYFNATNCEEIKIAEEIDENEQKKYRGVFDLSGIDSTDGITLYIGKSVKKLPDNVFYSGSYSTSARIKHVIFEDNSECKIIGKYAFRDLRYLESFTFGKNSSLIEIGYEALANVGRFTAFSQLIIPKSVEKISRRALTMGKHSPQTHAPVVIEFEDITGWNIAENETDYNAKTNGTPIDVSTLEAGSTDVFALAGGKYMYKIK